jgi:hypothetical protein
MAGGDPVRTLEEFQAIAEEHGGILGFCRTGDFWDVYIIHVEILRDRPPYRSVVSIDVGGTIHLVPEEHFREIVETSRSFRPLLAPGAIYEGMTARRELEEIAEETGGAVGYRCWLGNDRFEPVLVLLLRYFDEAFLDLQLGKVRLRLRESEFDHAVQHALECGE